jgi:zinc transport system permease protein
MKNALLGVLLISPLFGMVGTMVVNNKMAFFSDALGHSALTGIALGILFGVENPMLTMLGFAILLSIGILKVKKQEKASTDTIIGVFSSIGVALGIVILSYRGGFAKYSSYLIGDLLSITQADLAFLGVTFVGIGLFFCFGFNKLLLVSINPALAKSRGIRVWIWEYSFTLIIAVLVILSIQWVGTMIISSMLILPAAAARNLANNTKQYVLWAILIALFAGISGLIFSYFIGSASGATIVLVLGLIFIVTYGLNYLHEAQ